MRLSPRFPGFLRDEAGAVTADWVVLTSAVVGLGIAVLAVLSVEMGRTTTKVGSFMSSQQVHTTF